MTYQTHKIIHDLEDENPQGASDNIKTILNQKVAEMLDRKKPEVASAVGVDERGYGGEVRCVLQKFLTHRPVSTLDRVPFQLTGELFLYGMALSLRLQQLRVRGRR